MKVWTEIKVCFISPLPQLDFILPPPTRIENREPGVYINREPGVYINREPGVYINRLEIHWILFIQVLLTVIWPPLGPVLIRGVVSFCG